MNLMAAGSSLLTGVALLVCAFLDLLDWDVALEGVAIIAGVTVVFSLIFRSGLNRRFADRLGRAECVGLLVVGAWGGVAVLAASLDAVVEAHC